MDATESGNAKVDVDSHTYKELIILILQFLAEENCQESLHLLEQETKVYFNVKYFGETIIRGEWEKAENYLSAFTRLEDSFLSRKMFFEMRKHKYYEAIFRNDLAEAATILHKGLSVFLVPQDENYEVLTEVLSSKSIREDQKSSWYGNMAQARANLLGNLKTLMEQNPFLQQKLVFPKLNNSGLLSIVELICPRQEKETNLKEELVYLIFQFLDEENFRGTLHKLEQETKIFFNLSYFGEFVINREWDKAEKYLSAFTKSDDQYLLQQIFEMQDERQLELEASNRKNEFLKKYMDAYSLSVDLFDGLNQLLGKYPVLLDKLIFPSMDKSRLLTIFKQTMDWWVPHYNNARSNLSLDNIPKIPHLFHGQSVSINSSSLETGESDIPRNCWSNDRNCAIDVNSGVILKTTEKSESQASGICTSQKAMEMGSNCRKDIDCGVGTIAEIKEPSECCLLVLPDNSSVPRVWVYRGLTLVARLIYSSSGDAILALSQNGIHKFWLMQDNEYSSGKAIADIQPRLHQPLNGRVMRNDVGANPENTFACLVLTGHHLVSSSGGLISIYNVQTFEKMNTFAVPPPVATYFILLPQDIFAMGFDDSTVLIRRAKETKATLKGHQKAVTCLAFSYNLNVLVSSGADAQLCVWHVEGWEKVANKSLQSFRTGQVPDPPVVKYIEFHKDQIRFLSVHEKQIDIYEAPMLNHLMQSVPPECDLPITNATYSCDCQSIFVSFKSGCIKVMDSETLDPRCRISLTAFTQQIPSSLEVYPTVVAAHPHKRNQIAIGLSNGRVLVLEPLGSEKEWNMCLNEDGKDSCITESTAT